MVLRKSDRAGRDGNCPVGVGAQREDADFVGKQASRAVAKDSAGVGTAIEKIASASTYGNCEDGRCVRRCKCNRETYCVRARGREADARDLARRFRERSLS